MSRMARVTIEKGWSVDPIFQSKEAQYLPVGSILNAMRHELRKTKRFGENKPDVHQKTSVQICHKERDNIC